MLSAKELTSFSDRRVQRVDKRIGAGKPTLVEHHSHAVLSPIPRMLATLRTGVSVSHVIPPSKNVKAEASYVCVCNGRAESPVGRHHGASYN